MNPIILRTLGAAAIALLLSAACSVTSSTGGPPGSDRPPASDRDTSASPDGDDPPLPEGPEVDPVDWYPCDGEYEGFDCAEVAVPLDHDDPDGDSIEIALLRASEADPEERIGSLLVNPGGPGGSGIETATYLYLPDDMAASFDLVGFDPRGVGRSTSLDCNTHLQDIYDADATFDDEDDIEHYLDVSQDFVDECLERHADLLPHLGTDEVARDLDLVREALGDEQLTYLGWSYGTSIGQRYAALFPERVRAMVLDGVVDPSMDGLEAADLQARGFDRALQNFIDDCDASGCLSPDAETVIDEVAAAAEETPIPSRTADRPATPGAIDIGMAGALYSEAGWPRLARALELAADGDGSGMVELADIYLGREADGSYANGFEIYFAVSCLDSEWPDDPQEVFDAAKQTGRRYRLGESLVNDYVRCVLWPEDPQPIGPVPSDVEGLAPIVLISTTGDPATPHENAVAVADAIPGARLLTYEGEGHGVFGSGVRCIDDAVSAYLVDLELPDEGATC